jgi:hypothetical protein
MLAPILDILGHIAPTPVPWGPYNQCDEFESSLSDDGAIITLAQGTENGNSEAISDALSDDDEEEEDAAPQTWDLPPPPPGIHSSKVDAIKACNEWASKHGYAMCVASKRKKNSEGQIYIGGKYM